ncbi:MAG: ATP phosphoribosyltransferase regulatory subunit [Coriobacteriales bacterium]|jgi:ATP phosphoribosyltransferase regulatory subunit|nr:ATP phosphoribosyltransferase regulatory subunit [Coriobacteriales bacterium]
MISVTPRGFKDILPDEARWRESIITQVSATLSSWGYDPIETPTLEVLEVLEQGGTLSDSAFRLFDADGTLLVLRPDVTLPVARMVASRLAASAGLTVETSAAAPTPGAPAPAPAPPAAPAAAPTPGAPAPAPPAAPLTPLRFRYVQSVFREQESLRGQAREFTQLGTELIGAAGAAADGETVILFSEALAASGLEDFTIALCTVGVLRELIELGISAGGLSVEWGREVRAASHRSDLVALEELAADKRLDAPHQKALTRLFEIRGGRAAIEECRALVEPLGCQDGLEQLAQTFAIIEQSAAAAHVSIDFSVMSDFDYYTGMVFEAYAPGVGLKLGGGGRYDGMFAGFGADVRAAGFAFGLERVMHALLAQESTRTSAPEEPQLTRLAVAAEKPAAAFLAAERLRGQGRRVALDFACDLPASNEERWR